MGLIDNDRVVPIQKPVPGQLIEQYPVRHHLHQRILTGLITEPHLIPDTVPNPRLQLLREPLRPQYAPQSAEAAYAQSIPGALAPLPAQS